MPEVITDVKIVERTFSTKTIKGFDSSGRKFVTKMFKIPLGKKFIAGLMDHGWAQVLWKPSVERRLDDEGNKLLCVGWLSTAFTFMWGVNPKSEAISLNDVSQEDFANVAGLT